MKKNREKDLYINTVVIFISKIFTQFISLIVLPILTSELTTSEYGSYDLICSYGFLLVGFLTVQVESAIFRFLIDQRNNDEEIKKVITNGILLILKNFTVVSIIYFIVAKIVGVDYYIFIYLHSVSNLLLTVCLQICRGIGDNISYSIGSFISGVTNILLCFLFVYCFNDGLEGMIFATVIAYCSATLFLIIKKKIIKYVSFKKYDKKISKEMMKYALPLLPNNIMSWILSISDRIMLSAFVSTAANGIYSIATKFPVLLSHVYSVFNLSWTESASLSINDDDKSEFFSKQIDNIFKICISLCIITMSAMAIIFRIMINENYYEAYIYVPILIFASIFEILSGLLGAIYISLKKSKKIAVTTFLAAIINISINLIFMKQFGIIVACISTLVSYLFLAIYRYIDLNRILKLRFLNKKYIVIFIYLIIITYFYYYNMISVSVIMTLVSIILCIYINKDILNLIVGKIKNMFNKKIK